jgi:small subunit ribosomal protein S21
MLLIGVVVKSNEPFEKAIKRFIKSCEKNGIISDVKKRQRYEKPSEERKRLQTSIERKRMKETAELNRKKLY